MPPAAILFDLGNTILLPHKNDYPAATRALFAHAVNPRGITLEHFTEVFAGLYADLETRRAASLLEIPVATFQRLLFERLDLTFDLPPDEFAWRFWQLAESLSPMPGAHQTLAALRQKNIPLAALSNTVVTASIVEKELARHDLLRFFTFVMVSADYGLRKPHAALFLTAAGKLHLPPGSIWYVGDNYDLDVLGAHGAGLTPIWLNHKNAPHPPTAPANLRSIGRLPEILPLL